MSIVGVDIFCFKIFIRFGGLFVVKGASHGEGGGGYFKKFQESILMESKHELKLNVTSHKLETPISHTTSQIAGNLKLLFSLLFCYLCLYFCLG